MKRRLTIEMQEEDFIALKTLCSMKSISIKDFITPIIIEAVDNEEDIMWGKTANERLKKIEDQDLVFYRG